MKKKGQKQVYIDVDAVTRNNKNKRRQAQNDLDSKLSSTLYRLQKGLTPIVFDFNQDIDVLKLDGGFAVYGTSPEPLEEVECYKVKNKLIPIKEFLSQ